MSSSLAPTLTSLLLLSCLLMGFLFGKPCVLSLPITAITIHELLPPITAGSPRTLPHQIVHTGELMPSSPSRCKGHPTPILISRHFRIYMLTHLLMPSVAPMSLTSIAFSPHDYGHRCQGHHGHCYYLASKIQCMSNLVSKIHFPRHLEGL